VTDRDDGTIRVVIKKLFLQSDNGTSKTVNFVTKKSVLLRFSFEEVTQRVNLRLVTTMLFFELDKIFRLKLGATGLNEHSSNSVGLRSKASTQPLILLS
ncbi:hypothetical protein PINS_up020439, partial [Pythium insidiosum]